MADMMHADRPGLLQVRHLSCGYGDRPVLDGVSLEVREGEAGLLAGPNGGGKSTFLKAVIEELSLACRRTEIDNHPHRAQHEGGARTCGPHPRGTA